MLLYLLKSIACMAIFFAFYKGVLEQLSIHRTKRMYLLGAALASLIVPLISYDVVVYTPEIAQGQTVIYQEASWAGHNTTPFDWANLAWMVYLIGASLFGLKFFINLGRIFLKIGHNPKSRGNGIVHVLLREKISPHTFFRYIFFNKRAFESREIPASVSIHEEAHARQLHTLDILIIELLQVLFWFNPFVHLMGRSIKLNHEFLADQAVIESGNSTNEYQQTLLAFSGPSSINPMANAMNYSSIKKRLKLMKTQTSRRQSVMRTSLVIPLLALVLLSFTTRNVIEIPADHPAETAMKIETPISQDRQLRVNVKGNSITVNGQSATVSNFAATVDRITSNWNESDMLNTKFDLTIDDPNNDIIDRLNAEFRKTRLFKARPNDYSLFPPPPPPPPAPPAPNGDMTPPPPPPPPVKVKIKKGTPVVREIKRENGDVLIIEEIERESPEEEVIIIEEIEGDDRLVIRDTKGKRIKTVSPEVETIEIIKTPGEEQEYEVIEIKTEPGKSVYRVKGDKSNGTVSKIKIIDDEKDVNTKTLITSGELNFRSDKNVTYYIDGKKVSKRKVEKLEPSEIASLNVVKKSEDKGEVRVITKKKDN